MKRARSFEQSPAPGKKKLHQNHKAIKTLLLSHIYPDRDSFPSYFYNKCPGPQPSTFRRNGLKLLSENEYLITEKSDGERMILFIIGGSKFAFLVDRGFRLTPIPIQKKFTKSTILDGEYFSDKSQFLVFDAILINNKQVSTASFSTRLGAFQKWIPSDYNSSILPLMLRAKSFYAKGAFSTLLMFIEKKESKSGNKYVFHDEMDSKWDHLSDGFIFVPLADAYSDSKILKWKWDGMNTLDFRFQFDARTTKGTLFAAGYDGRDIPIQNWENAQPLSNLHGKILECEYTPEESRWTFVKERVDKVRANHITTVMSTLETIIDNVQVADITNALLK